MEKNSSCLWKSFLNVKVRERERERKKERTKERKKGRVNGETETGKCFVSERLKKKYCVTFYKKGLLFPYSLIYVRLYSRYT